MSDAPPTTPCISCGYDLAGLAVVDGHSTCPECKTRTQVALRCGRCRYSLAGVPEVAARATCPECGYVNVTNGLAPSRPVVVTWTIGEFVMATSPVWLVLLSLVFFADGMKIAPAILGGAVAAPLYFLVTSVHQTHFGTSYRRRPRAVYGVWIALLVCVALLFSCMLAFMGQ